MRAVLALLLTVFLAACAAQPVNEQGAIDEFYEAYNAEDYDALWGNMHSLVREQVDRDEFIAVIESARSVLGEYKSAEQLSTQTSTYEALEFQETVLKTTFETETADVTFRSTKDGDRVRLAFFNVESIKVFDEYMRRQRAAETAQGVDAGAAGSGEAVPAQ